MQGEALRAEGAALTRPTLLRSLGSVHRGTVDPGPDAARSHANATARKFRGALAGPLLAADGGVSRRPWLVLVLLGSSGVGCSEGGDADTPGVEPASIVGDTRADGEQPSVVRLAIRVGDVAYTCTGTLLGPRTIVTARHCLEGRIGEGGSCRVTVLLDRLGVGTEDARAERHEADHCEVREPEKALRPWRDVALVRLTSPVPDAPLARLAAGGSGEGRYDTFGYGSWGAAPSFGTTCGNRSDGHKRKATYVGRLGFRFGQSTCPGDSGGPHFLVGTSELAGITSSGFAILIGYETNSDLSESAPWILSRLAAFESASR